MLLIILLLLLIVRIPVNAAARGAPSGSAIVNAKRRRALSVLLGGHGSSMRP